MNELETQSPITRHVMLPLEFDPLLYREASTDLSFFDDAALIDHYRKYGEEEGRRSNSLLTRDDFVNLIPRSADALEIGPFCRPLLKGPNVRFFDVLDRAGLEQRAREVDFPSTTAPEIDYVSPDGDLSVVEDTFEYVLSSHCIEHQPDLVAHLRHVSRIMRPGGRYALLVPDRRYCFDSLLADSTVAGVLEAYMAKRRVHTLRSVVEHFALTTHNDPGRHWRGDHGNADVDAERVVAAVTEFERSRGRYIDVHAWCFTPSSMRRLMSGLLGAGYIDLEIERLYPTRAGQNEFWMVLKKPAQASSVCCSPSNPDPAI